MRFIYLVLTNFLLISTCLGQAAKMDFVDYEPISTLMVPEHKLTRSKFPFIDVHNHQNGMPTQDLGTLIQEMDKLNMKVMVNLSGQSGNQIISSIKNVKDHYPSRFIVFANIDFNGVGKGDWGKKAAAQLEQDVKNERRFYKIGTSISKISVSMLLCCNVIRVSSKMLLYFRELVFFTVLVFLAKNYVISLSR